MSQAGAIALSDHTNLVASWLARVERSYAHNSRLYRFLGEEASGEQVHAFLLWDAAQPPFFRFLEGWTEKDPSLVRPALQAHIDQEIREDHSGLYRQLLAELAQKFPVANPRHDSERLRNLNYTFSAECAAAEDFEFFAGSFFATEIMSGRRCLQLHRRLAALGISETGLTYLRLHFEEDQAHSEEVATQLLQPLLERGADPAAFERGISDRLDRSERYLRWYEENRLG